MTQTNYISIPIGSEELFLKTLCSGSRFEYARIRRNDTLLSKRRVKGLTARSLLPQISELWAGLSVGEKANWKTAGTEMGLNGWQLFVQDQSIRIKNSMAGVATPSVFHQSWVGEILITAPATECQIFQIHPAFYYVIHKVYGKKGQYEQVKVEEPFGLPLRIGLNYQSDLTADGADPFVKFYAKIWNSYQGVDDEHLLEINLGLQDSWQSAEATLSSLRGTIIGYALYIHLHDVVGSFYFDNIIAEHNATNWARDPYCKQVPVVFTAQFKQIPKHWASLILPVGAEYDTVYLDF